MSRPVPLKMIKMYCRVRPEVYEKLRDSVARCGRGWSAGKLLDLCFQLTTSRELLRLTRPHEDSADRLIGLHFEVTEPTADGLRETVHTLNSRRDHDPVRWNQGHVVECIYVANHKRVEKIAKESQP